MSSGIYKVVAQFEDSSGRPLSGEGYLVRLSDEDRYFDDKLGESSLSADGTAEFLISAVDILSFDSVGEKTPDLYFIVRRDGQEVFRSDVFSNVDFEALDPVTGTAKGLTKRFGPFRLTDH